MSTAASNDRTADLGSARAAARSLTDTAPPTATASSTPTASSTATARLTDTPPTTPPHVPAGVKLDRGQILDAAERVVRSEGLAVLTMRRIGTELGADPTAVYRHFRNKQELLTQLAERIFDSVPEIDPTLPWQQQLRVWMRHSYERYRTHPDLGVLLASQSDDIEPLVRIHEQSLDLLVNGGGLALRDAVWVSSAMENHVVGCGLFFAICDHVEPQPEGRQALRRAYALVSPQRYPLANAAAEHMFPDQDEMFEYTMELLIAAAERLAPQPAGPEAEPEAGAARCASV